MSALGLPAFAEFRREEEQIWQENQDEWIRCRNKNKSIEVIEDDICRMTQSTQAQERGRKMAEIWCPVRHLAEEDSSDGHSGQSGGAVI